MINMMLTFESQQVSALADELRQCTEQLLSSPYSPRLWLQRSKILLQLYFPDLACGDAYKALQLIRDSKDGSSRLTHCVRIEAANYLVSAHHSFSNLLPSEFLMSSNGMEKVKAYLTELEYNSVVVLAEGLLMAKSFRESLNVAQENARKFPDAHELLAIRKAAKSAYAQRTAELEAAGSSWSEIQEDLCSGEVYVKTYPWMSTEISRRSDIIHFVNDNLRKASRDQCYVKRSDIRDGISMLSSDNAEMVADVFGIFARTDVPRGRRVLKDYTCLCAVDDNTGRCSACFDLLSGINVEPECCETKFCSSACLHNANKFHPAVCGKDLGMYECAKGSQASSKISATEARLLLRALAIAVNFGDLHPLRAPIISRLTSLQAGAGAQEARSFSLAKSIVEPIDMLTRLGVDVYANHNFDTWVILTIGARLDNNSRHASEIPDAGQYYIAINPLYTFFNHSCHPNVTYEQGKSGPDSILRMKATRKVKAGEELFINYLPAKDLALHVSERQKRLRSWFGHDCQCVKCVKEMAKEDAEDSEYEDE